jgi:hypothetical protein
VRVWAVAAPEQGVPGDGGVVLGKKIKGVPKKKQPHAAAVVVLPHPVGTRGIIALGFSRDGDKLVTVGADNEHTVGLYELNSAVTHSLNAPGYVTWIRK